ncbi:MAG: hypothetical protein V7642_755 [Burkholderiales bacterium]|jgi:hypothetical protein
MVSRTYQTNEPPETEKRHIRRKLSGTEDSGVNEVWSMGFRQTLY